MNGLAASIFSTGARISNRCWIEAVRSAEKILWNGIRLRCYQWPVFGMLAQGSAEASDSPF